MSKDELADWSATASNNTDIGGISVAEGMAPADVNNAFREMMAQLATWIAGHAWEGTGEAAPSASLDAIVANGVYTFESTDAGVPVSATGVVLHIQRATTRAIQIAGVASSTTQQRVFFRDRSGDGWSAWREFLHAPIAGSGVFRVFGAGVSVGNISDLIDPTANTFGCTLAGVGAGTFSRESGVPLVVKRDTGTVLLQWYSGTDNVGSVTVSGGVVTYGSFCGSHWSQFQSLARPDILRGTILATTDRLCVWLGENDPNLPQVRVATAKSRSVYGVFSHWDEDSRDFHVASLGVFPVRMAPGSNARRGDLIESDENGMGVPQSDDIVRSSTVGKVIANARGERYPDGSFLLPCTLHCG